MGTGEVVDVVGKFVEDIDGGSDDVVVVAVARIDDVVVELL